MLYDVVQEGTGRAARVPGHEVAGKTGTTSDFKDAWFAGFAPDLVTVVWVGNDDSTPMQHVTGSGLPAQIWTGFMRAALKDHPAQTLARSAPTPPLDFATSMPPDYYPPETGWNYQNNGQPEAPPPQAPRRHRRGLLDWLFNWGDDEDEDSDRGRGRHRSENDPRELRPRAVQGRDGHWTRDPGVHRTPNYPPPDAAIPPPNTPPPPPPGD